MEKIKGNHVGEITNVKDTSVNNIINQFISYFIEEETALDFLHLKRGY